MGVFQVSIHAEAADDAVPGADRARVRIGARSRASGAAGAEDFVFTAFFDWRLHHEILRSFALVGRHAKAVSVSQVSFLAEASDDAVLGAPSAGMRIGAVRGASGAAGVEFLVVGACRDVVD